MQHPYRYYIDTRYKLWDTLQREDQDSLNLRGMHWPPQMEGVLVFHVKNQVLMSPIKSMGLSPSGIPALINRLEHIL